MMSESNQKTAVLFDVTYSEPCPDCAAAGVSSVLGLVVGVGIVCAENQDHVFEQLPSELDGAEVQESGRLPARQIEAASGSAVAPSASEIQSQEPEANQAGEPLPVIGEQLQDVSAVAGDVSKDETAKPLPSGDGEVIEMSLGSESFRGGLFAPWPRPGGAVWALVEIPESYALGLQAEAEAQHIPFPQYLKEWMDRAAEYQWY